MKSNIEINSYANEARQIFSLSEPNESSINIKSILKTYNINSNEMEDNLGYESGSDLDSFNFENIGKDNRNHEMDSKLNILEDINFEDETNSSINSFSLPDSFDDVFLNNKYQYGGIKKKATNNEIEHLKKLLNDKRELFQNLIVSEDRYEELCLQSENDMNIFDLACYQVYKHISQNKLAFESTRKELEETKHQLTNVNLKLKTKIADSERENQISSSIAKINSQELSILEEKCLKLTTQLNSELSHRKAHVDELFKYDTLNDKYQHQLVEIKELNKIIDTQRRQLGEINIVLSDSKRNSELLLKDNFFLKNELKNAETKEHILTREIENIKLESLTFENKVTHLTEQLTTQQSTIRNTFDEKIDKEIKRIRDDSTREVETLKAASMGFTDLENKQLRETAKSLEIEISQFRRRIDSLTSDNNSLVREITTITNQKNQEIFELKADIKLKLFELSSVQSKFEENISLKRQSQIEIDVLKEEQLAHKSALLQMKNEAQQRDHDYTIELEILKRRLSSYESLEYEIDNAIFNKNGEVKSDTKTEDLLKINELQNTISTERRIKLMNLTQNLLKAERKTQQTLELLANSEAKVVVSENNLEIAKENLSYASKPTKYLISKLRDEEIKRNTAEAKVKQLEEKLHKNQLVQSDMNKKMIDLKQKFQSFLQQREEFKTLRYLLNELKDDKSQNNYESSQLNKKLDQIISEKENSAMFNNENINLSNNLVIKDEEDAINKSEQKSFISNSSSNNSAISNNVSEIITNEEKNNQDNSINITENQSNSSNNSKIYTITSPRESLNSSILSSLPSSVLDKMTRSPNKIQSNWHKRENL